jgi:hypothetical protein
MNHINLKNDHAKDNFFYLFSKIVLHFVISFQKKHILKLRIRFHNFFRYKARLVPRNNNNMKEFDRRLKNLSELFRMYESIIKNIGEQSQKFSLKKNS